MNFDLGENWFTNKEFLKKVLNRYFNPPKELHFLEIGSWKGRSAIWFCENILLNNKSTLTCIDTWNILEWNNYNYEKLMLLKDKQKAKELKVDKIYEQFLFNIKYKMVDNKLIILKGKSVDKIKELKDNYYDFIYLDGDHSEKGCYEDLKGSWPKLKKKGILFGHDWNWEDETGKPTQRAVKKFSREFNLKIYPFWKRWNSYYFVKNM